VAPFRRRAGIVACQGDVADTTETVPGARTPPGVSYGVNPSRTSPRTFSTVAGSAPSRSKLTGPVENTKSAASAASRPRSVSALSCTFVHWSTELAEAWALETVQAPPRG
jgi:hypothetical protein